MTTYIGLLRAINLAGYQRVSMADLRDFLTALGFADVKTLLQSGNFVFRAEKRSPAQLERVLETESAKRLGLQTEFFVRTAGEWSEIIERNPFPKEAKSDPGHLLLMCLKGAADASSVKALQQAIAGRERVKGDQRQAYFVYPDGIGRSRLTNTLIERKLGTRGTARNWNTVLKLQALLTR